MHPCQVDFESYNSPLTDKVSHDGYHRFYPFFSVNFGIVRCGCSRSVSLNSAPFSCGKPISRMVWNFTESTFTRRSALEATFASTRWMRATFNSYPVSRLN